MRNFLFLGAGLLLVVFVAVFFYDKYRIAPEIKFDTLLLTDFTGNPVNVEMFKGKKLFINFFATWCGPCLEEIPSLEKAQSNLKKDSFQYVLISDEPVSRLKNFSEQSGTQLMILHSEKKLREWQIVTLPTTYVLNLEQEIVFKKVGIADWNSAEMIEKLKTVSEYQSRL